MERFLAAGYRFFFLPSILCVASSIGYFAWRHSWDLVGLLVGILLVGPFVLSLFLLPANLTSFAAFWVAKKGWRLAAQLVLLVSLTLINGSAAIATTATFLGVIWKGAPISPNWALVAGFGAATFPGCWIAFRQRELAGGLFLAFFAGLASSVMAGALLLAPMLVIPAALCVYFLALIANFALTAPKVVPRIPKTAFDAAIFAMYGNPPPPNTADPGQAAVLAEEQLGGVVNGDEVRGVALRLNDKDVPFNTHELAVAVLLHFLRRKDLMQYLATAQLGARTTVLKWFQEGKVNRMSCESFENVIYRDYQPIVAGQSHHDIRSDGTNQRAGEEAYGASRGISTDTFPNGRGEFGYVETNPIPCRKEHGADGYLSRLRSVDGKKCTYHRVGATQNDVSSQPIDCYSIQHPDGRQLAKLYLSIHQMRDSGKAPKGFTLAAI